MSAVTTKRYRLTPALYTRIALGNIIRKQWWVGLLALLASLALGGLGYTRSAILPPLLLALYLLFWWAQFYGLTKLEANQLMFGSLSYGLSAPGVTIFLTTKQVIQIEWKNITSARQGKDYFLLFLSPVHFIYLPYSAFRNKDQLELARTLLKNKQLI